MSSDQQHPSNFSRSFTSSLSLAGVTFAGRELGRGSYAVVVDAEHQGTPLAGKKLYQILLEDESSSGAQRLVAGFENEITTWYSLRHPHIVLLVGIHFEHGSRVPTLILEKMQSSLRRYIEKYKKEEVPLPDKVFILRQVSQALAYLHSRQPSLVHHDLSPNNILLNQDTLLTKITDFGMSRVVDPSHSTRKSSVKGTLAFMPPEALASPPKYTEKLDIFSFGNIVLFTLTHLWPDPGPSIIYEGEKAVAVEELQRREQYTRDFTGEERSLFFPGIQSCLDNRPDRRPTSLQLVQQMRQMEVAHPRPPCVQLTQQLKDKNEQLQQMQEQLRRKDEDLRTQSEDSSREYALLLRANQYLQQVNGQLQHENERLQQENQRLQPENEHYKQKQEVPQRLHRVRSSPTAGSSPSPVPPLPSPRHHRKPPPLPTPHSPSTKQVTKQAQPPRNWSEAKCQKMLQCDGQCVSVAVQGGVAYVGLFGRIACFSTASGARLPALDLRLEPRNDNVWGIAFIHKDVFVVSTDCKLKIYSTQGQHINTFDSERDGFKPRGLTVGSDGHIFVCDMAHHYVCVFNVDGILLSSFGSEGVSVAHLKSPRDVCMDREGFYYISDHSNRRICVYDVEGKFSKEFPTPDDSHPTCVAATRCGHLVVSSYLSNRVWILTTDGQLVHEFGRKEKGSRQFKWPRGMFVDNDNNIFISEEGNSRVQIY